MLILINTICFLMTMSSLVIAAEIELLIPKEEIEASLTEKDFKNYAENGDVKKLVTYINEKRFPSEFINENFLENLRRGGYVALAKALSTEQSWTWTIKYFLEKETNEINDIKRLLFSAKWGNFAKVFTGMKKLMEKGLDGSTIINNEGYTPVEVAEVRYKGLANFIRGYQELVAAGFDLTTCPIWQPQKKQDQSGDPQKILIKHQQLYFYLIEIQKEILAINYELILTSDVTEDINDDTFSFQLLQKIWQDQDDQRLAGTAVNYAKNRLIDRSNIWHLIDKKELLIPISLEEQVNLPSLSSDVDVNLATSPKKENMELFEAITTCDFDKIDALIKSGLQLQFSTNNKGLTPAQYARSRAHIAYSIALENNLFWRLFKRKELLQLIFWNAIENAFC